MATSLPFWIRSAKSASKKSGIRSGPRRLRIVKRTGRRDRYTNFPKIFVARVFDLTRRCSDKQCVHLPKAIEMADRDSARRGSSDSLVGGSNRLPSGITANTTNSNRFHDDRNLLRRRAAGLLQIPIFLSRRRYRFRQPILDNSTISAFRRWCFKPGTPARVRIPITFVLTGAQY